ncbi:MAG: helix-turn-helix domain-containing protein, partial [Alphaproteobacteria bacterium]|nr:helix-turn-helix domain-containing protein [Alphaproteobacteria bacterium]
SHLPDDLRARGRAQAFQSREGQILTLEQHEEEYIRWVLDQTKGNQSQAARLLGIDRVSLWRKLRKSHDASNG